MDEEHQPLLNNHGNRKVRFKEDVKTLFYLRYVEHPTTNTETLIHLVKANIGIGILSMPFAMKNSGLYFGLVSTLAIGFICTHCMHMLLKCSHELCYRLQIPSMDYSEVSYYAFKTGPLWFRKYSTSARNTVNWFLCITQFGICCVYLLFVALSFQNVVEHYYEKTNVRYYLLALLIPMILLIFLRNLKILVPISILSSILSAFGLSIIFYFISQNLPHTNSAEPIPWSRIPLFFGTTIGAFEGIPSVLPLENNMRTPQAFGGLNGVLTTGMTIVAALYASVGFFGYLKYGQDVQGSITFNLDQDSVLAETVRVMFALAIFLSCGLQFYIPLEIIGPKFHNLVPRSSKFRNYSDSILRIGMVLISFILAMVIPKLTAIISLIGAFGSSSLALIFPPILEISTFGLNGMGRCYWKLWKNVAIVIFGIVSLVSGTYSSSLELMNSES